MRPFLISRRMTSTTTLRRGDTSAAIEVPSALLIMIASPRPTPSIPGPLPAHIAFIRTAQESARYLRRVVDRHVHKGGQPVDDGRETIAAAVDAGGRDPCRDGICGCGKPLRPCGRPMRRIVP